MQRSMYVAAALCAAALTGCGLIDSNVADFDLSMPERSFTVDTEQWELTGDERFPELDCSDQPQICSAAVQEACAGELCFGSCNPDDMNCQALLALQLWSTVDLVSEKPELQEINEQPLVSVQIDRVYYEITENTLNIATPELTIYVAPQTVMSPGDPAARAIGTIEALPAGTTVAATDVVFTEDGELALHDAMKDYQTPFNLLVGTQMTLHGGDVVPTGRAVATVNVQAHAGL
jgi:hypothetical protein